MAVTTGNPSKLDDLRDRERERAKARPGGGELYKALRRFIPRRLQKPADSVVAGGINMGDVREGAVAALPDTPGLVTQLVRRCLAKEPTQRYEHAGALAEALAQAPQGAEPESSDDA